MVLTEFGKVTLIVQKRLGSISPEENGFLPIILQKKPEFFMVINDKYFALFFVDDADKERIIKLQEMKIEPFPFLIKPNNVVEGKFAFSFENSKFMWLENCLVQNMYSINLGKDTTIILIDHKQIMNTEALGKYEYLVKLGYIISFGKEINRENFYFTLQDLIAYSIKAWSERHGNNSS